MFKFFIVLAGHDMVTDAGRASTFRRKFEVPSLQTKSTENEGLFKNMGFTENRFEDYRKKFEKEQLSRHLWNNPVEHKGLNETVELRLATRTK